MDYIEYIQIFITLVLGMAFSRVIVSYAVIIKNIKFIKLYWPYFPISVGLLLFIVNDFWTGFERSKTLAIGNGFELKMKFVAALVSPLCYTLIAEMLHPKIMTDKVYDMRDTIISQKTIYVLAILNTLQAIFIALFGEGISSTVAAHSIQFALLLIFIIGVFAKSELLQKIIATLFFLMALLWFLFENAI